MEFPIKILNQLRPILRGFRKAQKLTQSDIAKRLGITQQSYAQLEANPATASLERLFKVLAILQVEVVLRERQVAHSNIISDEASLVVMNQTDLDNATAFADITNELTLAFSNLKKKR